MKIYEKMALKYKLEALIGMVFISAALAFVSIYQSPLLWSWFTAAMCGLACYTFSIYLFASFEKKRTYIGSILLGFLMCKVSSYLSVSPGFSIDLILATVGSFFTYWGVKSWMVSKAKWEVERFEVFLSTGSSLVVLMVGSGVYIEKWLPKTSYLSLIYTVRDGLIFAALIAFAFFQLASFRQKKGLQNYVFALRFFVDELKSKFFTFKLIFIVTTLAFIGSFLNLLFLLQKLNDSSLIQQDFGLMWIMALSETLSGLLLFRSEIIQSKIASQVLPIGTKRFISKLDRGFSAHTSAVPSFIFFYDFDLSKSLKNKLPATMFQIQNEDIRNSLVNLSSEKISDFSHVGSLTQLVVDPSQCRSVAGDSLFLGLMISLELSRSARQRSVMLSKILPILDQELSRIATPHMVDEAQKSAVGFYYLDFGWIDQHLVRSKRFSRIASSFEPIPSFLQGAVLQLRESGVSVENYIWLSQSAKQRVVDELPNLKSIIEMRPVKSPEAHVEHMLYTIRFDQLAARLDHTLHLQSERQKVMDREPSAESLSLIETLNRRLNFVKGDFEVSHLIRTIHTYQWSGFREKDLALLLLIRIWHECVNPLQRESQTYKTLMNLLVDCISEIGYPTKYLHSAQLRKNNFRSMGELRKAALDVSHERFAESWSLLSSGVYGRISDLDADALKIMMQEVISRPKLMAQNVVRNRIMDVVCFLLAKIDRVSDDEIAQLMLRILRAQASPMMELELLTMWLDRWQYVASDLRRNLKLSEREFEEVNNLIKKIEVYRQKNLSYLFVKLDYLKPVALSEAG